MVTCTFQSRNQKICGEECQHNETYCPKHMKLLLSSAPSLVDQKLNDIEGTSQQKANKKRAIEMPKITEDKVELKYQKLPDHETSYIDEKIKHLEELQAKMQSLKVCFSDDFKKIMLKKAKTLYYHEKKNDKVLVDSLLEKYKHECNENATSIPFRYFQKETNHLFDEMTKDEKQNWIDKMISLEGKTNVK